jgi:putative endopeptidase
MATVASLQSRRKLVRQRHIQPGAQNVKTRLFAMILATLAGCGSKPAATTTTPPATESTVAETSPAPAAPAPAKPKPELGTWGFDESGMDKSVPPGDSFFRYANGQWLKTTKIPEDKSNYGMFTALDDLSKNRMRAIIDEAAKDPNSKIGQTYNAFLDTAAIEAKGLAPFEPWLSDVRGLSSKADYPALVARADRLGIGGPFPAFVNLDDKQNDQYILNITQGGIGMPDRDYYLKTDA